MARKLTKQQKVTLSRKLEEFEHASDALALCVASGHPVDKAITDAYWAARADLCAAIGLKPKGKDQ